MWLVRLSTVPGAGWMAVQATMLVQCELILWTWLLFDMVADHKLMLSFDRRFVFVWMVRILLLR